jgi:hypothetical protein
MRSSFVVFAAPLLLASAVQANPMFTTSLRARAVAGPHVQLTYAALSDTKDPIRVKSFGKTVTPWTKYEGFRTNMGSGITSTKSLQMCDCFVPIGVSLGYEVELPPISGRADVMLAYVTAASSAGGPIVPSRSGTGPDGGYWPWEIPELPELQGLDCTLACSGTDGGTLDVAALDTPSGSDSGVDKNVATGSEAGVNSPGSGGVEGKGGTAGTGVAQGSGGAPTSSAVSSDGATATSTQAPAKGGGGSCSISHDRASTLSTMLLLTGLVLALRRRRAS